MDNSTDANSTCTECGEPMTDGHTCVPSTATEDGTSAAEEPRIEIPESLWASGLFKPAFARPEPTEEVRTPAGSRGSIFNLGYEEQSDTAAVEESPEEPVDPFAWADEPAPEPVAAPIPDSPSADPFAWAEEPAEDVPQEIADEEIADEVVDASPAEVTPEVTEDVTPYDPFEAFGPTEDPADETEEADEPVDEAVEEVDAEVDAEVDEVATPEPGEHFGSADLPSSVPFVQPPVAPAPRVTSTLPEAEEVAEEKKSLKWLLIAALVLVLVAGTGGWFAWQRQQDAPIRTAFDASHSQFNAGASQLEAATSIEQIALAGQDFTAAVPLLEETADRARERGSSFAASARRASLAELEVARAGATLADLSATSLSAWSTSRPALERAFEEYADARTHVEAADGTPTDGLTADLLDSIQQLIGDEVAGSAAKNTTDLLDRLQAARLVADWRGIGDDAGALVEPMKAAEQEFAGDDEKGASLAAYRSFFSSLTGLSALRPANLDGWEQVKRRIETAITDLPSDADRATRLLGATDRRIVAARTKFADWQSAHAAAKAEKQDGLEQLRVARELVPEATETHATLRSEVADILSRGGSFPAEGNEGEAYRLLTASVEAHEALRARLAALTVPSGAASEYAALVQVLADDTGAVRWASDAAAACTGNCELTDRPGWKALTERSGASEQAWETAREAWASAATAARDELRALELPKRPKI